MYYLYLLASQKNGTLYTGITSNIKRRTYQHKLGTKKGFTQKYGVNLLVYFEKIVDFHSAILREKQIKSWKRQWKIELIERNNPDWRDLDPESSSG